MAALNAEHAHESGIRDSGHVTYDIIATTRGNTRVKRKPPPRLLLAAVFQGRVICAKYADVALLRLTAWPGLLEPVPATFSTMTCWPSVLEKLSAVMRAMMSVGPPAANGTIMAIGFVGNDCAMAP